MTHPTPGANEPARVVVFGPHPDDQELGMGGTIARLAAQGHHVLLADMTNGEPTPFGDAETRAKEAAEAARVLSPEPGPGAGSVSRVCLGLPNREVEHTLAARRLVAGCIRAWQAEIVFVTHPEDAHPDHRATTRVVDDARFDSKLTKTDIPPPIDRWTGEPVTGPGVEPGGAQTRPIYPKWVFYYYATHLRRVADPSLIFDTSGYVEIKSRSIVAYHTQFVLPEKNRAVVDWVEAAGTYFGSRIGTAAGEPFFTREPLGLEGFGGVV